MTKNPLADYLNAIERELKLGNPTEHSYRPALKTLLETIGGKNVIATNESRRIKCGAPDYIVNRGNVPIGYVETKNIDEPLDAILKTDQLKRYLNSLSNLILTNYLEFRWFVDGNERLSVRLSKAGANNTLKPEKDGLENLTQLLEAFFQAKTTTVNNPKELASRMASVARLIKDAIYIAFEDEPKGGELHQQLTSFREVLLHDLTPEQFADMYAQTICYGLFAARCSQKEATEFSRQQAAYMLPKTNPFLRKLFAHIAGLELEDQPFVWAVDDLVELLKQSDIEAILRDFGKRTRQEDPVVHFYETFLSQYDPKLREVRGVYYTPEPIVSYIVNSVDSILKQDFGLSDGLADATKINMTNPVTKESREVHKVQILDPATGTGTFLHGVVNHIFGHFRENRGMWSGYVKDHLLPRLYGFELLMAPYAVAHMKLGLQLAETGYDFTSDERIRVYLTNTLEEVFPLSDIPFARFVAEEAEEAKKVKKDVPVMVILGNPPYSGHSANKGGWIRDLLHGKDSMTHQKTGSYFEVDGQPLGEKNPKWLNDDYVKFIRFAQWRIEQTGYGILAFISNHGYLDNPTFRGMRKCLMETFDDIYVLDLHGNSKKKERCPDGSKDENVFDIQQGVAIGIFVKRTQSKTKKLAQVHHADLWGVRDVWEQSGKVKVLTGGKYYWLGENQCNTTPWTALKPQTPYYLFIPQNMDAHDEYQKGKQITEIFLLNSVGIVTARDSLTISWDRETVWNTINDFVKLPVEEAREKYKLGKDARDWKVNFAQQDLKQSGLTKENITPILYRPFDQRYTYYTGNSRGFHCMPRGEVMKHMQNKENLALISVRQVAEGVFNHVCSTRKVIDSRVTLSNKGISFVFPLYLYLDLPSDSLFGAMQTDVHGNRRPNLNPAFITECSQKLKLTFIRDGKGDLETTFGPEDMFAYIYALLHSPAYRSRYAEFLKIDFPRLPLTSNQQLFKELSVLGNQLVQLHLMESTGPQLTRYPIAGDNMVEKVDYAAPSGSESGKVWINKTQYFEAVPSEIWEFQIGGYQVCHKWLKDRKGRKLTYDDLTHYQRIVSTLSETIRLMSEIDALIDRHGGWPIN